MLPWSRSKSHRPSRTRLDDHLEGPILLEQFIESLLLGVLNADGSVHELTCVAYDGDHRIRCVSVDSCDKHGWSPWVGVPQDLE